MAFAETNNLKGREAKSTFLGDMLSVVGPMALGALGSVASGGLSSIGGSVMGSILGKTSEAVEANGGSIPQMMNYQGGGTHEQNPIGGIPVDYLGNPSSNSSALVEANEVGYKLPGDKTGYVFSDRIKIPGSKSTFASEAKKIASKYKNRLGKDLNKPDSLAKDAMDMEMSQLKDSQEQIKQVEQMDQIEAQAKALGGYLKQMAPGGTVPSETDNFLKGSGYKESMIGSGIQALTRLPQLFTQPNSVQYDRVSPELVDYAQERGGMETSRNNQLGFLKRQASMAGSAGQALNYLASAVPSAYNQYDQQYAQSIERQQNTNAQLMNQANAQNAQIQMREAEANAMEQDAARGIRDQAISDIGSIGAQAFQTKPKMMQQYNMLKAQGLIGDYDITWNPDGSPKITRKRDKVSIEPTVVDTKISDILLQNYLNADNTQKDTQRYVTPEVYNGVELGLQACGGSLKKCKGGYLKKKSKK